MGSSKARSIVHCAPPSCPSTPVAIMKALWEARPTTCDIRLIASGGEEIQTHASVLIAASPVFAAMLTSGMTETATKEINLPCTSFDVVESVMKLLYLGTVPRAADRMAVLKFAHTYSIVEAVKPIADELVAAMDPENAGELMRMLRDFDKQGTNIVDKVL